MSLLCTFLILLILIQRGKGGGLAGAFGGMGGQSAFGTKAGDTFMRITIVAAAVWFVFCILIHIGAKPSGTQDSGLFRDQKPAVTSNDTESSE
ncbi:MAG: preprotein translocase subunit SecG [Planctomycetaceae bacterium]|nr:preprotein translocase subunit SecG [Planctomycetaceae bacterium]